MAFICPHCKSIAFTRSSRQATETLREAYLQCSNLYCGHTFKTLTEIVATLSPSATPNPKVFIRLGGKAAMEVAKDQLPLI
jgi:hypothetical protein